jgi:hypothetical protein
MSDTRRFRKKIRSVDVRGGVAVTSGLWSVGAAADVDGEPEPEIAETQKRGRAFAEHVRAEHVVIECR